MNNIFLSADKKDLDAVIEFLNMHLDKTDCSIKTRMQLELVAEEVFVNIANYAYEGKKGNVRVGIDVTDCVLTMVFEDSGIPYDPLKKEDPDIKADFVNRPIGGLGIYLVRKLMDEIEYERRGDTNVLTLKKQL